MLFFSGMFFPRERMAPVLRDIGDGLPWAPPSTRCRIPCCGCFPSAQLLLVLAGWAVVFGVLAVRFFRWE